MNLSLLRRITESGAPVSIQCLDPPLSFHLADYNQDGTPANPICKHASSIDTDIPIRHGTALTIRGALWLVTEQTMTEPMLGRPVLAHLGPNVSSIQAKPRKYPSQKRNFVRKYVGNLLEMKFVKPEERNEWVASPLIFHKKPPTMFCFKMDYRLIDSATTKTDGPCPISTRLFPNYDEPLSSPE